MQQHTVIKRYCYTCRKPTVTLIDKEENRSCAECHDHKPPEEENIKAKHRAMAIISIFLIVGICAVGYVLVKLLINSI